MRRIVKWHALPLVFSSLCSVMAAQSSSPAPIRLDVVTQDAKGQSVKGLGQQDFVVLDNGNAVSPKSFAEVSTQDANTSVMLVVDLINGGVTYTTRELDQLTKYLRQNDGKLSYPTELTVVSENGATSTNSPTANGNALADVVSKINVGPQLLTRAAGGAASQQRFNISTKALDQVLSTVSRIPGRKMVLWLSPGWPLMSGGNYNPSPEQEDVLFKAVKSYSAMLRQNRIVLYSLNSSGTDESPAALLAYTRYLKPVSSPKQTDFADLSLQVLTTQSGGLVLNQNDLNPMIARCLEDAGEHYEITFDPSAASKNAPFHSLEIRVNHPGVTARTRTGYYPLP